MAVIMIVTCAPAPGPAPEPKPLSPFVTTYPLVYASPYVKVYPYAPLVYYNSYKLQPGSVYVY